MGSKLGGEHVANILGFRVPKEQNQLVKSKFDDLTLHGDHQQKSITTWNPDQTMFPAAHGGVWLTKVNSEQQLDMYWNAFATTPGCEGYMRPRFEFSDVSLAKLRIAIVPTPDETKMVIVSDNINPLREKLEGVVSKVKSEMVGGGQLDGYELAKINVERAVQIMEFWGWQPTVQYDSN